MTSLYDALGGEAALVELAVLTALRVDQAPLPAAWKAGAAHVVLDDERLAAYWRHVLGAPQDHAYDGPCYLISPTEHDAAAAAWLLERALEQAVQEPVVSRSSRVSAVLAALVRWDLAEALDQLASSPELPERTGAPVWGWSGPEDEASRARQDVMLERLRAEVREVLRPDDPPISTRLAWVTTWTHGMPPDDTEGFETTMVLEVTADGDASFAWHVPLSRETSDVGSECLQDALADWISTSTTFGWGREIP